jgi:hypothetical protein
LCDHRLEDVIFLIQYLGLGQEASLKKKTRPDGVSPRSVREKLWVNVAREHPEFFHVTDDETTQLSLRYFLKAEGGKPPPLNVEDVQKLVQNAVVLHEMQVKRAEGRRSWVTLFAALVAAASSIAQIFLR